MEKIKELLEELDTLLSRLEDYTHGNDGKEITIMRGKIIDQQKTMEAISGLYNAVQNKPKIGEKEEGSEPLGEKTEFAIQFEITYEDEASYNAAMEFIKRIIQKQN